MKTKNQGLSHREIAVLLGISHTQVQNIERQALDKMRRIAVREKMLCAELFESNPGIANKEGDNE